MPTGGPAEGTNGFFSNNTRVTVYRCKDCDSKICQLSNYEIFDKIGETKNGTLSNDIIQLVTTETHIIMCFQQEIKYLNEVYAIFWQEDWGIGESCGNLELGGKFCWESSYEYIDNTFLVVKPNCNIFGQTVRLMRKLTYQNESCFVVCFFFIL